MRVAHVSTVHRSTDNRILRKECASLAADGFDVHLIAVAEADRVDLGVQVRALPARASRWARMLQGPLDAWRLLRDIDPALVHVHDPELIPLAILWARVHNRPAVYDAHEDLPAQVLSKPYLSPRARPLIARLARSLEGWADRSLDGVIAATPSIARNYQRAPVTMVQNFPWLRDFPAAPSMRAASRSASYIGGVSHIRGVREMLAAAELRPSFRIVMAGPAESPQVEALVERSAHVDYQGVMPATALPELLAGSQVGLVLFHPLPNHLEAQPTKLFEYMAAGIPFVASDFLAWRRLLEPYECGLFVDPKDVSAIHGAVTWLLDNPDEAAAMGRRGRLAMVDHFTFEAEARHLVELTRTMLPRP